MKEVVICKMKKVKKSFCLLYLFGCIYLNAFCDVNYVYIFCRMKYWELSPAYEYKHEGLGVLVWFNAYRLGLDIWIIMGHKILIQCLHLIDVNQICSLPIHITNWLPSFFPSLDCCMSCTHSVHMNSNLPIYDFLFQGNYKG